MQNPQSRADWKSEVAAMLKTSASAVDDFVDQRWRTMKSRMGWDGKARIQPYIGMANEERLWLSGRVLSNPIPTPPTEDDSWWDNLLASWQRFESDEVPGVVVALNLDGRCVNTVTDEEGYFRFEIELANPLLHSPWHSITLSIVGGHVKNFDPVPVDGQVRLVRGDVSFGIISDMDDTVIHTGMAGLLTAAKATFLQNSKTRTPLKGVGELYQAFADGLTDPPKHNPIFYVSSSPWNLFDLLVDFLRHNELPLGPLLLQDLGVDQEKFIASGHDHKLEKIRLLLKTFPNLPFILIGDSGQRDAELYAQAVDEHPDRIQAAFIRDVDPGVLSTKDADVDRSLAAIKQEGVLLRRVETSVEIAEEAIKLGLISLERLPSIKDAVEEGRTQAR